jgi:hypothetical protein
MKRMSLSILVCVSLFTLSGCASIVRGERETLDIKSTPSGARVTVLPYREVLETPASIKVRRDRSVTLIVEKEGYRAAHVYLDREPDPIGRFLFMWNAPFGLFVLGMSVDLDRGSFLKLVPNPVEITLERDTARSATDEGS